MILVAKISHYYQVFKQEAGNIVSGLFFFVFFRIYLATFLILNSIVWFAAYYVKKLIDEPRIALHYNIDSGIDYYGSAFQIYFLPALGLLIFLTNMIIFAVVRNQQDRKFIGHAVFSFAIAANFILLIGCYLIYIINFK